MHRPGRVVGYLGGGGVSVLLRAAPQRLGTISGRDARAVSRWVGTAVRSALVPAS